MKITPVLRVVVLLTLFATSLVQAQTTEKIALYADRAGTDCSIDDTTVRTLSVYIIHEGTGSRTEAKFGAPKPDCWTGATWVGEVLQAALFSGTTQSSDLQVAYTGCLSLPIYVGRMIFEVTGAAQACCRYPVLPSVFYPGTIIVHGCTPAEIYIPILGGSATINENASCPCAPPLAVESTTWGQIKSLYQ